MTYTQNAWKGANYDSSLGTKEITSIVRTFVKTKYPDCKFSVTKDRNSITVCLMQATFDPFETPDVNKMNGADFRYGEADFMNNWNRVIKEKYIQVNHYYIDESKYLTEQAKEMFKTIVKFINSYNYDDSDAQTDYFNTNFYLIFVQYSII
jgi:hypothetical protein